LVPAAADVPRDTISLNYYLPVKPAYPALVWKMVALGGGGKTTRAYCDERLLAIPASSSGRQSLTAVIELAALACRPAIFPKSSSQFATSILFLAKKI